MSGFKIFQLPESIMRALEKMQFETPTPIQTQAIPLAQNLKDVIGIAQTGTGKTGAFSIPILTELIKNQQATALVLVPTRELALQIEEFFKKLCQFSPGVYCTSLIGGVSMQPQMRALSRNPRFVIATPGRLLGHLQRRTVDLSKLQFLVLDEADRMLDMGFAPQLSQILKFIPAKRQTMCFTATWSPEMDSLSKKYLYQPQKITVGEVSKAAHLIDQALIATTVQNKNGTLLDELNRREGSVLVFTRTKSRTDRVAKYLASYGVQVNRIHGGRTQVQRKNALADFKSQRVRVLVATDIAARGIDVNEIKHVINFDLPQLPEDYIHRIGRTGRAGLSGEAVSFVTPEDRGQWNEISRLLKKTGSQVPVLPGASSFRH